MTYEKLEALHGDLIKAAQNFADCTLLNLNGDAPAAWQDQWRALTAANGEFATALGGVAVTAQT